MSEKGGSDVPELAEAADRESHAPTRGSQIRSWAIFIAAIASFFTAIAAYVKPEDRSVTKQSYEELSTALSAMADQNQKNHDDIVALRTYLADKNGEMFVLPSQGASPPVAPLPSFVTPHLGLDAGAPHWSIRLEDDAGAPPRLYTLRLGDAGSPSTLAVVTDSKPLPTLHPFDRTKIRTFDEVMRDAKK